MAGGPDLALMIVRFVVRLGGEAGAANRPRAGRALWFYVCRPDGRTGYATAIVAGLPDIVFPARAIAAATFAIYPTWWRNLAAAGLSA